MRSSPPGVMRSIAHQASCLSCSALAACRRAGLEEMPEGFVYLRDVDPTIEQDMRYATFDNFTGSAGAGLRCRRMRAGRPAAEALKRVQDDVAARRASR